MMKREQEIKAALAKVLRRETNYSGMTYEQGVEEALSWVLEELDSDDFEFAP